MLTLGWSDGNTFMPVNSNLLSSENDNTVVNIPENTDKRTNAFKRRKLSRSKANDAMITLIKEAKAACIKASYVLFDSWFSSPASICKIKNIGYDVIAMVKKTSKVFMCCTDELADVSFAQAFSLFMELFVNQGKEFLTISELAPFLCLDFYVISIPELRALRKSRSNVSLTKRIKNIKKYPCQ